MGATRRSGWWKSDVYKRQLLLCALCAWSAHAQAHGTVLRVAGFTASSRACQAFAGEHSQVALEAELSPYQYTSQLLNALVSGSFPYDVFTASSASFDLAMLMDKGYCADLSGVEAVRETVQRMGEPFASLVTRDGCIYGIQMCIRDSPRTGGHAPGRYALRGL